MAGNINIPCFLLSSPVRVVSGRKKALYQRFLLSLSFGVLLYLSPALAQDNPQLDVYFNVSKQNVSTSDLDKNLLNSTALDEAIQALSASDPALAGVALATVTENVYSGNVVVQACPMGTYSSPSVTGCVPCPAGTYSLQASASNSDACQRCAAGTWSSVVGASAASVCTQCPANTYSSATASNSQANCLQCPQFGVSPAGSTSISQCSCGVGYYAFNGNCTQCLPGNFCANGGSNQCPSYPNSNSLAGAAAPTDCFCIPGFYGAPGLVGGTCEQCPGGYYCQGGPEHPLADSCPYNSDSPFGASSMADCTCARGYKQNDWSTTTWNIQTSSTAAICTTANTCSSPANCGGCMDGVVCGSACSFNALVCVPTQLNCTQGYLQLFDGNTYQANMRQTWIIAPVGAATVTIAFTSFCTELNGDLVTIYSCDEADCSKTTTQLASYSGCTATIPAPVTSPTPYMKVTWLSNGARVFAGWQATYSSTLPYTPLSVGINGKAATNTTKELYMWLGDTLNVYSATIKLGLQTSPGTGNVVDASTMFQYIPIATGKLFLVDTLLPTRNILIVVLPAIPTRWNVQQSYNSTLKSLVLSGDITGVRPTIYLTIGDELAIFRPSSGWDVVICTSVTPNSASNINGACVSLTGNATDLQGQGTAGVTWRTANYAAGTYYYTTTSIPGQNYGTIVLVKRPPGMSCEQCQAGEYCYAGDTFVCPANSMSYEGAEDPTQCFCIPGYYTDTTDMQTYQNSQYVDSGGRHSCVVTEGSLMYCWGANEVGQLGIGKTSVQETPTPVSIANVSQVALGTDFTCVIMVGGKVRCWGGNNFGQLGLGSSTGTGAQLPSAISDANLGINYMASQLSCADYTCCAIVQCNNNNAPNSDTQIGVKCWGKSDNYKLGYVVASNVNIGTSSVQMGNTLQWVNIGTSMPIWVAHGGSHGCAIVTGGNVYCWGVNTYGQLGLGSTTSSAASSQINLPMPAKSLSCYSGVCCVLDISGRIRCWGQGEGGRLGTGTVNVGTTSGSMGINLQPVNVGTTFSVLDVQVGGTMTCALLGNNQVKCWGLIGGQIVGSNPATQMANLLPAIELNPTDVAIQISGKSSSSCVILNTYKVACWGLNNLGQLGGPTVTAQYSIGVPASVTNMTLVSLPLDAIHSSGTPAKKTCSLCPSNYYCTGADNGNSIVSCGANAVSLPNSASLSSCKCVSGYTSVNGVCAQCQSGTYCAGGTTFNCPANSISPVASSRVDQCACKAGYSGRNGSTCNVCQQGQYKASAGDDACYLCPAGTASKITGASTLDACVPCPAGTFSLAGSTECTPCQPAHYSTNGSAECLACAGGTYSVQGSSACTSCAPGTYGGGVAGNDASACSPCLAGRASNVTAATNSTVCVKCLAGGFSSASATSCGTCLANTYSIQGSSQCTACPGNSVSVAGSGPLDCKCLIGYISVPSSTEVGFTCTACLAGSWAALGDTVCTLCAAGTSSSAVAAANVSTCKTCAGGTVSLQGSASCRGCPATYSASAGSSVCTLCPVSYWSAANASTCTACQEGKYALGAISSAAGCVPCTPGYYCPAGMVPQMCPMGTYSSATGFKTQSQCQVCPKDSFCPMPYLKSSCPAGTTSPTNSTSQLQCKCQSGYQCSYTKMVQAVVVLNMSMMQFAQDGVSSSFRQAVASAAGGIPVQNVVITNVVDASGTPTGRRLFSMENRGRGLLSSENRGRGLLSNENRGRGLLSNENRDSGLLSNENGEPTALQMGHEEHIHVVVGLLGAETLDNVDYHLEINGFDHSMAHEWYQDHTVSVREV